MCCNHNFHRLGRYRIRVKPRPGSTHGFRLFKVLLKSSKVSHYCLQWSHIYCIQSKSTSRASHHNQPHHKRPIIVWQYPFSALMKSFCSVTILYWYLVDKFQEHIGKETSSKRVVAANIRSWAVTVIQISCFPQWWHVSGYTGSVL